MATDISVLAGVGVLPRENAPNHPSAPDDNSVISGHNPQDDSIAQLQTDTHVDLGEPLPFQSSSQDSYRMQTLEADYRSLEAFVQTRSLQDGVLETAQLLVRSASVDIRISSHVLESYAENVRDLHDMDPELLQDYLALIKLLDETTPESFDAFFDELRSLAKGETREGEEVDVEVRRTQVETYFFEVHASSTSIQLTLTRQSVQQADPLVLDLDGDGIEVSHYEDSTTFDIDADGRADQTAFTFGGDAMLALDRNDNGKIDDGTELFGDQNGAAHGFAELGKYDDNQDLVIDARDAVFNSLKLFDGVSMFSLASAGITGISTVMASTPGAQVNQNPVVGSATFTRDDGSTGEVADVLLKYR